jgi:RNA polymerase sigma-70 factor (ECF subfamily)
MSIVTMPTGDRSPPYLGGECEEVEGTSAAQTESDDYTKLYLAHRPRIRRLCVRLLADADEADDVAQEVFAKLFQAQQDPTRPIAWAPWLTRVTINACRDRRRSRWWRWWRERHEEFQETEFQGNDPTPEQAFLENERRQSVWRAFRRLPARQQEVFVLRQLEGYSTAEAADLLGVSTGSVKRHLYRAVHQMRNALRGLV